MQYVAILRARRVLFWFAVGALVVEVLVVSFLYQVTRFPRARTTIHRVAPAQLHPGAAHDTVRAHRGGVRVAGHHPIRTADTPMVIAASPHRGRHAAREPGSFGYSVSRAGDVWLSALLGIAAYAPLLLAPFLALGLDAEYRTAAIAWTRPTARLAIAGRYVAVDALALLLGWLGAVGLVTIAMGILGWGGHLVVDGFVPAMLFVAFAAPVLWYGLIVAISALVPGHGTAVMGATWAACFIMAVVAGFDLPPAAHALADLVNHLSPFHYLYGSGGSVRDFSDPVLWRQFGPAWLLGLGGIVAGVRLWATRDVPA